MDSQKLKDNMAMLDSMIAQLKVFMERLEKKGMQTDELYLDWKRQVNRMQGTLNYLRLSQQNKREKSA